MERPSKIGVEIADSFININTCVKVDIKEEEH